MGLFHEFFGDPVEQARRAKGERPRERAALSTVRNFDRCVLTPIFWLFNIAAVAFGVTAHWWWLVGAVVGSFYSGIIGAKIHPKQSFSDLSRGSVTGAAADREAASLTDVEQHLLVSHACTHVGILLGVTSGGVLWAAGLSWYVAAIVGFVCLLFSGAILKVLFRTER